MTIDVYRLLKIILNATSSSIAYTMQNHSASQVSGSDANNFDRHSDDFRWLASDVFRVLGNWKMNGDINMADQFLPELFAHLQKKCDSESGSRIKTVRSKIELSILPAHVHIDRVARSLYNNNALDEIFMFSYGAQRCSNIDAGARTGEISCRMLRDLGCKYCLIGHSEARNMMNCASREEIIALHAEMISSCIKNDIIPVLCVSDYMSKDGIRIYEDLENEINATLSAAEYFLNEFILLRSDIIIAYEPVSAIGTGIVPEVKDIREVAMFIKRVVSDFAWHSYDERFANNASSDDSEERDDVMCGFSVLYGGSVNVTNCHEIATGANIDGLLIGGASLSSMSICDIMLQLAAL